MLTFTGFAVVVQGALICVVTGEIVRDVLAAGGGLAEVVRAEIPVVAVCRDAPEALPLLTDIPYGAEVVVHAWEPLVGLGESTLPGLGVTGRIQARRVSSLRFLALDYRQGIHFALVREGLEVAEEGPVAEVSVLDLAAVFVGLAIAVHGHPDAYACLAHVSDCAGVSIIAGGDVEHELAVAGFRIAAIIGADVVVITDYANADTGACLTVVTVRAEVTVQTLDTIQGHEVTSISSQTAVLGASILIVTCVFIYIAVTIVVDTVTDLGATGGGVTFRETIRCTDHDPGAYPELVLNVTGGREAEGDGGLRALTDSLLGEALRKGGTIHSGSLLADEAVGTGALAAASPAAEPAQPATEVHARRLGATDPVAIAALGTRHAKAGVVRDTDVDHIRIRA